MAEKKITLTVGKDELVFKVETENYNRFINETKPDDKVLPAKRFLRRSLADKKAQGELLDELFDKGVHLEMVGKLLEEFQGDLEIEVKK